MAILAACGAETTKYTVGGSVSGLSGTGLILANNGGSGLSVAASGTFTFPAGLESGASYDVAVQKHPDGQACVVANGSGTVNAAAVTSVVVTCSTAGPLTLVAVDPADGARNVARNTRPAMTFSSALGVAGPANLSLQSPAGSHPLTALASGNTLTATTSRKLLPVTTYTLTASAVRGSNGEQQSGPAASSFTTSDAAWQSQEQLVTDFPGAGFRVRLGMNGNGDALALWLQNDDLWMRYYTRDAGWGPAKRVQANAPDLPRAIVMDTDGNAIVLWEIAEPYRCSNEDGCTRFTIRVRRYTVIDGWGSYRTIDRDDYSSMRPAIAMNSSGTAILAWTRAEGAIRKIRSMRYTASGWEDAASISPGGESASDVQVAVEEDGDAMVVWDQVDSLRRGIWANRYTAGSGWDNAVRIEDDNTGNLGDPRLVLDRRGNALVLWTRYVNLQFELWWSRYTTGAGWGGAAPVGIGVGGGAGIGSDAESDASGNVIVIYAQFDAATPEEGDSDLYAVRYTSDAGWSAPVIIGNNRISDQRNPELAMDASGNALAVWQEFDGTRFNSWSSRFTPDAGWQAPVPAEDYNGGSSYITFLQAESSGDMLALFADFVEYASTRIYTKRFE